MAVLRNANGNELLIDCNCGCDEGLRFRIDTEDSDWYCFLTYTNGVFYREQGDTFWRILRKKLRKIWAIIRNKDYYYSEITMTKDEFEIFREYITCVDKTLYHR